jgi:hypothetical protein
MRDVGQDSTKFPIKACAFASVFFLEEVSCHNIFVYNQLYVLYLI